MPQTFLTVDLGFGDAGKGSIIDFLAHCYGAHTVVRYNGGAQAAHRVVTTDGRAHVFSQFGSGTLAGAATHLSRFMLIDPPAMAAEAQHLQTLGVTNPLAQTTIDGGALVITPFQRAINRLRELARRDGRHGSCGIGIGETMHDFVRHGDRVLFAADLARPDRLVAKLNFLRERNLAKLAEFQEDLPDDGQVDEEMAVLHDPEWLDWLVAFYTGFVGDVQVVAGDYLHALLRRPGTVLFEGAQGALLDEWYGFHPYTTWSTTTLANAEQLLAEADYGGTVTRIGITRASTPRHGAGPLVSEDEALARQLPDAANRTGPWQGAFRVGWLDLVLLRYALAFVGSLDMLAVTCLDRVEQLAELKVCTAYQYDTFIVDEIVPSPQARNLDYQAQLTRNLACCTPLYTPVAQVRDLLSYLEDQLEVPVGIISRGETAADKQILSELPTPA